MAGMHRLSICKQIVIMQIKMCKFLSVPSSHGVNLSIFANVLFFSSSCVVAADYSLHIKLHEHHFYANILGLWQEFVKSLEKRQQRAKIAVTNVEVQVV